MLIVACMDRPIPPEPAERPRIRKAMRAAHFMKWATPPVFIGSLVAAFMVGWDTVWYAGAILLVIAWGAYFGLGYSLARCPRCGQVWWGNRSGRHPAPWWCGIKVSPPDADETESFVCRRCRLNIGLALRE